MAAPAEKSDAALREMLEQLESCDQAAVRRKMLLAGGWAPAVYGSFGIVVIVVMAIAWSLGNEFHFYGPSGVEVESTLWKVLFLVLFAGLMGTIALGGFGFLKRKDWARRLLVSLCWFSVVANVLCYLFMVMVPALEVEGVIIVSVGFGFVLLFSYALWRVGRFYASKDLKAWCSASVDGADFCEDNAYVSGPEVSDVEPLDRQAILDEITTLRKRGARRMNRAAAMISFLGLALCCAPIAGAVGIVLDDPELFSDSGKGLLDYWFGYFLVGALVLQVCVGVIVFLAGLALYRGGRREGSALRIAQRIVLVFCTTAAIFLPLAALITSTRIAEGLLAGLAAVVMAPVWVFLLRLPYKYFDTPEGRAWCAGEYGEAP